MDFVSQVPRSSPDEGPVIYSGHLAVHPLPPTGASSSPLEAERGGKGQTGMRSTQAVRAQLPISSIRDTLNALVPKTQS